MKSGGVDKGSEGGREGEREEKARKDLAVCVCVCLNWCAERALLRCSWDFHVFVVLFPFVGHFLLLLLCFSADVGFVLASCGRAGAIAACAVTDIL